MSQNDILLCSQCICAALFFNQLRQTQHQVIEDANTQFDTIVSQYDCYANGLMDFGVASFLNKTVSVQMSENCSVAFFVFDL